MDTDRRETSVATRQYRLAQLVVAIGALALGAMVVDALVDRWHESIFLYYGLDSHGYAELQRLESGVPVSFGQFAVAVIALVGIIGFAIGEVRRTRLHARMSTRCGECSCSRPGEGGRRLNSIKVERLSPREWYRQLVLRTSLAGGGLFAAWCLQMSFERWLGGHGWGLAYADVRSLLPLASIFGVCLIAGILVAVVTIVGMRVVRVLEVLTEQAMRRLRAPLRPRLRRRALLAARTLRELLGVDILSRPPPVRA